MCGARSRSRCRSFTLGDMRHTLQWTYAAVKNARYASAARTASSMVVYPSSIRRTLLILMARKLRVLLSGMRVKEESMGEIRDKLTLNWLAFHVALTSWAECRRRACSWMYR